LLAPSPPADNMPAKRRRRTIADYSRAGTRDYVLCGAVESAKRIGNQWRLIVVRYLLERPMRFNELLKVACGIDPKTLSRVLKHLTKEEIVRREVLDTQPFMVRYALTEKGRQISPIMQALKSWGEVWVLPFIEIPS
jgi:DNA-binding HxlR family transcriptional regulator